MKINAVFSRQNFRISVILLLFIFLLNLIGCTSLRNFINFKSPALNEGEIYKKEHQPERKTTMLMPIILPTMTTIIPYSISDDEDFIIYIRKWNEEKGEFMLGKFWVDKKTYEKADIGDWFNCNMDMCDKDDPDIKKRN